MTQSQIVRTLAEECQVSKTAARQFLQQLTDTALREVKKSGLFVLPGLGRLVRAERKARIGRNPATGETIQIPAKRVVKFRVAKAVKDAILQAKAKKAVAS
jgi:DNA-binding protein HU-beta